MKALTSDTPPLSRPKNGDDGTLKDVCAIDCTTEVGRTVPLPEPIASLIRDSLSANSRRAYTSDLARFKAWGGSIPTSAGGIAEYLAAHATTHAASTLVRWLTSLAKAHRVLGVADPTQSEMVHSVLRGIRRRNSSLPGQAKPLMRDDLFMVLDALGSGPKADRDRALLLIGFAGGFRRSEIVGLDTTDIETVKQGVVITIRRSKTDQLGIGRKVGVPFARGRHCAVAALEAWLTTATIKSGPIFRPITRHGKVRAVRLSGEAVSLLVEKRLAAIGIAPEHYSGHSLRAGFVTSAAQAGVSSWKIREQTGHRSEAMLTRYIRNGEMFLSNAAGALL